mgnify:CR=1 FL=1
MIVERILIAFGALFVATILAGIEGCLRRIPEALEDLESVDVEMSKDD